MRKYLAACYITIYIILNLSLLNSQTIIHSYNLDFEDGAPGNMPIGWTLPSYAKNAGYSAALTDLNPLHGRYCIELSKEGEDSAGIYGSVMQSVDASQFRGKKIRFRAAVRAELSGVKGSAHLWVREHLSYGQDGLFMRMEDQPIVINNWEYYEIIFPVNDYADVLNFGLLMFGSGKSWLDDASLVIIDEDSSGYQAPGPLSDRAADNIAAFAKLMGYIRYFYPGTEAGYNDWERTTLAGVESLENVKTDSELIDSLNRIFLPFAPGLRIYNKGAMPDMKFLDSLQTPFSNVSLGCMSSCIGLVTNDSELTNKVHNIYLPTRKVEGLAYQNIDVAPLAGRKIRVSAMARVNLSGVESQGQIILRIDDSEGRLIAWNSLKNPIVKSKWQEYSLDIFVPEDAATFKSGLALIGEGSVFYDEVKIKILDSNAKEKNFNPKNNGFELGNPGEFANSWIMPTPNRRAGYDAGVTTDKPFAGRQCLQIISDPETRIVFPKENEIFTTQLSPGISASFPLILRIDSMQTLPYPPTDLKPIESRKPAGFTMSGRDRTSRLAICILAYNIFRNFNLFNRDFEVWDSLLKISLKEAAECKNENEFLGVLQKLLANTGDAQARIWHGSGVERFGPPFLWDKIGTKLFISKVDDTDLNITAGSEVVSIDDTPAADYIRKQEEYISGSSPQWKTVRALAEIRAGEEGSEIKLMLKPNKGDEYELTVKRNTILSDFNESRPGRVTEVSSGVLYIDMTRMNDGEFKALSGDYLSKYKTIIFDVRGLSLVSDYALGYFIDEPLSSFKWRIPIYTMPDDKLISYKIIRGRINKLKEHYNARLIFLEDERSVGYSESILAVVKHYKLGTIIGTPSAGTCGEIIPFRLPGDYNFTLTSIEGIQPDGKRFYGKGVEPDISAPLTLGAIKSDKDPALMKALSEAEGKRK
ncbi:MAG: TSPc protein [Bacteroidota bacterium]|nr:TSPc protein [Bacteroidota bacterium]